MTNKFWQETKEILSEFIYETKEYAAWVAKEVKRQYHLSILKEIGETYPETQLYTDKAYSIIDAPNDENFPDFTKAPEHTSIDSGSRLTTPLFETEEEADAFKFAEKMQELCQNHQALLDTDPFYAPKEIEDGFGLPDTYEPRYPYDTEPSA
jgi:hypothetical protein